LQVETDIVESRRRSDLRELRTRRHHPQSVVDLPRAEAGPMVLDRCSHACIEPRNLSPAPELPGIRMDNFAEAVRRCVRTVGPPRRGIVPGLAQPSSRRGPRTRWRAMTKGSLCPTG